jgi:hypothetical protein
MLVACSIEKSFPRKAIRRDSVEPLRKGQESCRGPESALTAPPSTPTPTLTTWGMILLAGALLLLGMKAAGRSAVVQQYPARRVRIA